MNTPEQALAQVGTNTFLVEEKGNGRPRTLKTESGGKEWTREEFLAALQAGEVNKDGNFYFTPIINGKKSDQKVELSFKMSSSNQEFSVGQPQNLAPDGTLMPPGMVPSVALQSEVVQALVGFSRDYHDDLDDARDQIDQLREKNTELLLKIKDLENEVENAKVNQTAMAGLNRAANTFMAGPGPLILMQKLLSGQIDPAIITEAVKATSQPNG